MLRLRQSSLILCVCLILGVSCVYAQTAAKAPAAGKQGQETPAKKYNVEDFTYSAEGARNPFEPILLMKAKTSRGMSVKASKDKGDRPSEKVGYELEELRLVGVIKSGTGMIAMMEDTQGKGIFFRKGDRLNNSMWVMDVLASSIVLGYKTKGETKKITVDIPTKN